MTALLAAIGLDWRAALLVSTALALGLGGYAKGFSDAASSCKAQAIAVQLKAANAALKLAENAKADAIKRGDDLDALNSRLEKEVSDYADALSNASIRPGPAVAGRDACRLDPRDVERLRAIH